MWCSPWSSIQCASLLCKGSRCLRSLVSDTPLFFFLRIGSLFFSFWGLDPHLDQEPQFASTEPFWHLQDNCGFLACLAFPTCDEVSYALQANAIFELRVHLLAEKAGFNDFKQSFLFFLWCGFFLLGFIACTDSNSLSISHSCCLVLHPVKFPAFKLIV